MVSAWPVVVGYLVGSIPFAWLVVYFTTGHDLRSIGSGNVGAANALRATRWQTGVMVALLDAAKGAAAVALAALGEGGPAGPALAAASAVVGHIFPVWLRFRGGKGVATASGAFAVLAPGPTAVAAAAFVTMVWLTRIVSVGSLTAAIVLTLGTHLAGSGPEVQASAAAAAVLVVVRHAGNLSRLARGTERHLGRDGGGRAGTR